jgi:hypothetical protein
MTTIAFLASTVDPRIASAAAQSALGWSTSGYCFLLILILKKKMEKIQLQGL